MIFESRYKFFTPPDYFAQDLANIMRIPSSDRIHIHAMLAYPDTQVSEGTSPPDSSRIHIKFKFKSIVALSHIFSSRFPMWPLQCGTRT